MPLNHWQLSAASADIERLHARWGGSTYSLLDKNLSGRRGFSVSPYPERLCKLNTKNPSKVEIAEFISKNVDLLELPNHCVGTWLNEVVTEIDVVIVLKSEFRAILLGMRREQRYIFDLQQRVEIRVSVLNLFRAIFR